MLEDLPNPHDRYFRESFADPDVARDFFRHYLPPEIAVQLDLSNLELVDGSFVDETLRDHASDLLYRLTVTAGGVHARLSLRLLQMVFSPELGVQLPEILALVRELTEPKTALQWLETALRYVVAASPHVGLDEVQSAIDIVLTDDRSDIMPTLAERWIEQGKQQGLEQGLEQGRRQMAEVVIAILTSRLGELQPEVSETLRQLSMAHLQQVTVAALDFDTSQEVSAYVRQLQQAH